MLDRSPPTQRNIALSVDAIVELNVALAERDLHIETAMQMGLISYEQWNEVARVACQAVDDRLRLAEQRYPRRFIDDPYEARLIRYIEAEQLRLSIRLKGSAR